MGKYKNGARGLNAGAATADITPKNPQFLFGYPFVERMSKGTHDPLLSSALFLANDNGQALLVSNDVIYVGKASVARIREGITAKTGIQGKNIMIGATHTHSGPVTVDCMNSSNDPVVPKADTEYVRYMENRIIETACSAYKNAAPAKAAFFKADGKGIGTNRHDPYGPADLEIPVVVIKNEAGSFIAAMLACNMHPTILHEDSKLYSGDFPAFAREILQKQYLGSGCHVLYFTGAAGNQSPRHVAKENTFSEARRIGEIVATAIGDKIKEGIGYFSDIDILSLQKQVDLPRRKFPCVDKAKKHRDKTLERFKCLKKASASPQDIRTAEVDWFGAEELLHLSALNAEGKLEEVYRSCLPAEIQVIKTGPYNFAAWPGEIYIEYAIELKEKLKDTFIISLANGELQGYVATKEAEGKGCYEASNSIFHYSSGKILVEETIKLIETKA